MLCLMTSTSFENSNFGNARLMNEPINDDNVDSPVTNSSNKKISTGVKANAKLIKVIPRIDAGITKIILNNTFDNIMSCGSIGKLFNNEKCLPSNDKLTADV